LGAPDGTVTGRIIRHYKELARGGTGLVIVEYTWVDKKASKSGACQLGAADDEHIAGLSWLAQVIQANGAKAALQIEHCGRQKFLGTPPIKAPSRVPWEELHAKGGAVPEELTFEEIEEIVKAFGDAARRAQIAGFDMVELHGAHGYLVTNFLSPRTNKRTDWYGGSLENRMRFLLESVKDIRSKVGPDFPLGVRLSGAEYEPDGIMIEETIKVAKALEKLGVDIIHISGGNHHQGIYLVSPMGMPLGIHVWAAEAVKKAVGIPIIASGSITTPELAEEILKHGKADFVSLGRSLFADPYWPEKAREGRPEDIVPCIRCNIGCVDRSMSVYKSVLCSVNVALGREDEFAITRTEHPKRIAVVGGGPAGMEAARVCRLRGCDVTVYEKRKLGGVLHEASVPEFKFDIRRLITYFVVQMEKLKIKVIPKEATIDTIKDGNFDAVIVAIGGIPIKPEVPGIDRPNVADSMEVLRGEVPLGQRVHIVGGGAMGTEVGLFLAQQGKEIIFTTRQDDLMAGVPRHQRILYQEKLEKQNVTIYTGKRLEAVLDNRTVVTDRYGNRKEILTDTVVFTGFAPQTGLSEQLERETNLEVYAVGDCVEPRNIFDAIHEGHLAAKRL
jgi:2,4-dienoyl-CoA reductase-like NADH-dependent reductase (Old Yellow Enzyme family)/thioredoxin reductase